MLDLRTYRDQQVADRRRIRAISDPDRTIAGRAQLDWLKDGLRPAARSGSSSATR